MVFYERNFYSNVISAEYKGNKISKRQCIDDMGQFTVEAKAFADASGHAVIARFCTEEVRWGNRNRKTQPACGTLHRSYLIE